MSTVKTRGSYPHPVLDASDDVASFIEVFNPTVASSVEDVEIRFQVRMTDPDIQSLLDAGQARYISAGPAAQPSAAENSMPGPPRTTLTAPATSDGLIRKMSAEPSDSM
jgi:hypothetical protein